MSRRPLPSVSRRLRSAWLRPTAARPDRRRKVVVVDAGHGGHDSGAIGASRQEKDLTLAAAEALKARLERSGRYRVVLTRDSDVFIPLETRVRIARDGGADLFISLHADSAGGDAATHGASVYTLSDSGGGRVNYVLGRNEWFSKAANRADAGTSQILLDLTQRSTRNRSATFAELLLGRLASRVDLLPRGHRDAGYFVLLAPDVPAALLEMGFITNPEDEHRLADPEQRGRMMDSVAEAIDDYFAEGTEGRGGVGDLLFPVGEATRPGGRAEGAAKKPSPLDKTSHNANNKRMSREAITAAAADHLEVMVTRAERRRMSLENIARGGEALAKEIVVRFIEGPYHPEPRHEPGRAFANVSRSVRLTLTLEAKTDEKIFAMLNRDVSAFDPMPSRAANDTRADGAARRPDDAPMSADRPDAESERLVDVERPDTPTRSACRATVERIAAEPNRSENREFASLRPPSPDHPPGSRLSEPPIASGRDPPGSPRG